MYHKHTRFIQAPCNAFKFAVVTLGLNEWFLLTLFQVTQGNRFAL